MQLQVGDRYSDETGEWEVVSRPVSDFRARRYHPALADR